MWFFIVAIALALWGCGERQPSISVQLFPAALASDPQQQADPGWQRVEFAGSGRAVAGVYFVRPDTLLSEWNIIACKPVSQPDGALGVAVRLNAYAMRKMEQFSGDEANLRQPLALRINGRWADFAPLLDRVRDRMALYGFTQKEIEDLEAYLKSR